MEFIKYLTIHASATYPSMDIDVEWIRDIHVNQNGWSDVGYHFFIKRDGTLQLGRDIHRMGAQVLHWNANNIGICMAGGLKEGTKEAEDNFTDAQFETLTDLLTEFHEKHPDAVVMGHNGFKGHESRGCPCFDWKAYREYLGVAWEAPAKPHEWSSNDWKIGVPDSWLKLSWYNEVEKQ